MQVDLDKAMYPQALHAARVNFGFLETMLAFVGIFVFFVAIFVLFISIMIIMPIVMLRYMCGCIQFYLSKCVKTRTASRSWSDS